MLNKILEAVLKNVTTYSGFQTNPETALFNWFRTTHVVMFLRQTVLSSGP